MSYREAPPQAAGLGAWIVSGISGRSDGTGFDVTVRDSYGQQPPQHFRLPAYLKQPKIGDVWEASRFWTAPQPAAPIPPRPHAQPPRGYRLSGLSGYKDPLEPSPQGLRPQEFGPAPDPLAGGGAVRWPWSPARGPHFTMPPANPVVTATMPPAQAPPRGFVPPVLPGQAPPILLPPQGLPPLPNFYSGPQQTPLLGPQGYYYPGAAQPIGGPVSRGPAQGLRDAEDYYLGLPAKTAAPPGAAIDLVYRSLYASGQATPGLLALLDEHFQASAGAYGGGGDRALSPPAPEKTVYVSGGRGGGGGSFMPFGGPF